MPSCRRGGRERHELVALARGGRGEAGQRPADVVVHARPLVRERRDVEGDPHGRYVKERKCAPRRRRSCGPGTFVRPTAKRTVQTPPEGRSGTRSVVCPSTGITARPTTAP